MTKNLIPGSIRDLIFRFNSILVDFHRLRLRYDYGRLFTEGTATELGRGGLNRIGLNGVRPGRYRVE